MIIPAPPVLSMLSMFEGTAYQGNTTGWGAGAWPSADLAMFIPILLLSKYGYTRMAIGGATASGNVDVGIYTHDGSLIVSSGSTAVAFTSNVQEFNITDGYLDEGAYYLAIACDNTTATFDRTTPGLEVGRAMGVLQMATAFPLPATATFAALSSAYVPLVALSDRSVV